MATTKTRISAKQEKINREIQRRNAAFKKATAAEKRVLIAKDVIAQIKAKKFKPTPGMWVLLKNKQNRDLADPTAVFEGTNSVRKLFLAEEIPSCSCCALGAVFMSCTLYNNKTTIADLDEETDSFDVRVRETEYGSFTNGLTKFFSRDQLQLIEIAFEGGGGAFDVDEEDLEEVHAADWVKKLRNAEKRLVAIMQNIIDNKGRFVP